MSPADRESRRAAFALDAMGYAGLLVLFYFVYVGLPMAAMGEYDSVQRALYLKWTPMAFGFFFVQHLFFHAVMGASMGQRVRKLTYVTPAGQKPALGSLVVRAALSTLIFPSLILAPGPAIGFHFGPDSAPVSLTLLIIGCVVSGMLALRTDANGQTLTERLAGIRLVRKG